MPDDALVITNTTAAVLLHSVLNRIRCVCHSAYMEYNHISHFLQEMALRGMAIRKRLRGVGYQEQFFQRANHGSST